MARTRTMRAALSRLARRLALRVSPGRASASDVTAGTSLALQFHVPPDEDVGPARRLAWRRQSLLQRPPSPWPSSVPATPSSCMRPSLQRASGVTRRASPTKRPSARSGPFGLHNTQFSCGAPSWPALGEPPSAGKWRGAPSAASGRCAAPRGHPTPVVQCPDRNAGWRGAWPCPTLLATTCKRRDSRPGPRPALQVRAGPVGWRGAWPGARTGHLHARQRHSNDGATAPLCARAKGQGAATCKRRDSRAAPRAPRFFATVGRGLGAGRPR